MGTRWPESRVERKRWRAKIVDRRTACSPRSAPRRATAAHVPPSKPLLCRGAVHPCQPAADGRSDAPEIPRAGGCVSRAQTHARQTHRAPPATVLQGGGKQLELSPDAACSAPRLSQQHPAAEQHHVRQARRQGEHLRCADSACGARRRPRKPSNAQRHLAERRRNDQQHQQQQAAHTR